MKIKRLNEHYKSRYSINMTPLIDVIFLLMIFFLMTINLNKPEGVLGNQLPEVGRRNTSDAPKDFEIVRLRVKMIKDNQQLKIFLQERVVYSYEDLLYYLDQLPKEIMIILEPSNNVPYKHVIGVYNMCLKSRKSNIVFSIPESAGQAVN